MTMATLHKTIPTLSLTVDDLRFLTYVQQMAVTAQSDTARHLFREYMELEKRRLIVSDDLGLRMRPQYRTAVMADTQGLDEVRRGL